MPNSFGVKVQGDVARLFYEVPDDFRSALVVKGYPRSVGIFMRYSVSFSPGQVQAENRVRQRLPFIDGNRMRHAVASVRDDAHCTSSRVQRRTAWMALYLAGQLKVSNIIWVERSRLALGFKDASVNRTGYSSGRRGSL